jgi:hypothetical protein
MIQSFLKIPPKMNFENNDTIFELLIRGNRSPKSLGNEHKIFLIGVPSCCEDFRIK